MYLTSWCFSSLKKMMWNYFNYAVMTIHSTDKRNTQLSTWGCWSIAEVVSIVSINGHCIFQWHSTLQMPDRETGVAVLMQTKKLSHLKICTSKWLSNIGFSSLKFIKICSILHPLFSTESEWLCSISSHKVNVLHLIWQCRELLWKILLLQNNQTDFSNWRT